LKKDVSLREKMKLKLMLLNIVLASILCVGCTSDVSDKMEVETVIENEPSAPETSTSTLDSIKILSLGDSYTIGQNVCNTCRFPEQLKDSLRARIEDLKVELKVIARTGWTTSSLKSAIATDNPSNDYDLTTLLIGVNNQFQNRPFELFETEFPELVDTAAALSNNKLENVIVVSIPDYAFTPFGGGRIAISQGIDRYNGFIQNYCAQYSITYINITDITRLGLVQPALVANDGLHPSALAYSRFVERILPKALEKIGYTTD